ncbi:hypothetical protein DICVIV_00602 [Dictyocaulus viviparus]|uniref:Asn/Gln amidotransferase domain-containing protein n=1 Tax=Dictyocaulus viviparus TaxID=29172 RepID=A0A0D8YAR0_DICVI|nr:hypothetical protein DICVIV_00602 [Dictyocaulus viviparus]
MRDKEVNTDYRFTPEPNLPIVKIQPQWIEECVESTSSTPTHIKYQELGFDPKQSVLYAENPELSRFVDLCANRIPLVGAEHFVTWMNELRLIMQKSKEVYPPENPEFAKQFMVILELYVCGRITKLRGLATLRAFITEVGDAVELFTAKDLWRITDKHLICRMVDEVFDSNHGMVEKALAGRIKSINSLRRLLVDHSSRRIDVDDAMDAVTRKLSELRKEM